MVCQKLVQKRHPARSWMTVDLCQYVVKYKTLIYWFILEIKNSEEGVANKLIKVSVLNQLKNLRMESNDNGLEISDG